MGRLQALALAESLGESLDMDQALTWHLRGNHYPPVPVSMVPVCRRAIEIGQAAQWGDADSAELIKLPDGISWRGQDSAPAYAIIEAHHLDSFIDYENGEE